MLKKLLSTPTAQLGKASRFVVFQIKLWSHCWRLLTKNRAGQQAAALSYHTIFGIVPLTILILLIFQLFPGYSGIGKEVKNRIYEQLQLSTIEYPPNSEKPEEKIALTEYLDDIVGGFLTRFNEGSIALFSAVIVVWASLSLLSTIERAFNHIWHVGKGRSFLHRISNCWAILTLGPLLLIVGVYITTQYSPLGEIQKKVSSSITPIVLSYILSTLAFSLLYVTLPNTKVQAGSAIWGAAVAALVWSLAKWGFRAYVIRFIPYSQVYGVLGLIPLGVFWIFVTWYIVLFGLQLTFTTQHLQSLDAAEIVTAKETEEYFIANDLTAINIVREIALAFKKNDGPAEAEVICSKLNLPAEFGEKILDHLVVSGIIMKTSEPKLGYVPAKEPANIKLSDISAAVAKVSFAQSTTEQPDAMRQITQTQQSTLTKNTLSEILGDLEAPSTLTGTAEQDSKT